MQVAQRGTSSTSTGYASVGAFNLYHANTGVTITQSQDLWLQVILHIL